MPPKATGKKGKPKAKAQPEIPVDPYLKSLQEKTIEQLKEEEKQWKIKAQKEMQMRSLALCDRDQSKRMCDAVNQELENIKIQHVQAEHKIEEDKANHELRMRQLEMEVKTQTDYQEDQLEKVDKEQENEIEEKQELHEARVEQIKKAKAFVEEMKKQSVENQERALQSLAVNIELMKQRNQEFLDELAEKLEARVTFYTNLWTLRRRVELKEIEERKNRHIFILNDQHRAAFNKTKQYYNEVTQNNLKIIRSLKKEIEDVAKRNEAIVHDQARMAHSIETIHSERKPIEETLYQLREDIAQYEKDMSMLHSTRVHITQMRTQLRQLQHDHEELQLKYAGVLKEKADLEGRYEDHLEILRQRGLLPVSVLKQRTEQEFKEITRTDADIQEIVHQEQLDPGTVDELTAILDELIETKNKTIEELKYEVIRITKAQNDAINVLEAKLIEMGIPESELGYRPIITQTVSTPAGLVSALI
ncbi:putative Dynein regulatory complex subunit 4 [Blattamonas nauphoetae]|uniref:Dynein regulatory complex subunit 4 n=1 Tax=Blattamonas nauphoetae TaxID=2049346 RepID=A0ABQ9XBL4_9EUKA|nr:putative Dynein regulatory complex subunit 4 [Blattamonas nauphoetae]